MMNCTAYMRLHVSLWKESRNPSFAFEAVTGDLKGRLRAFVKDLRKFHYALISAEPAFSAMTTQTAQLSLSQIDIHHVLKYEELEEDYADIVSDDGNRFCIDGKEHLKLDIDDIRWTEWQQTLGLRKEDLKNDAFRKWLGLPTECGDLACSEIEDLVEMDILYIFDAMDYEVYSDLLDFYAADFVCFDYTGNYHNDVLTPLISRQELYPGFPIKNRTKTTWDLILEYHGSKHS